MTNLLVNSDFETGDLTGWNVDGNSANGIPFMIVSGSPYNHSGSFGLATGPVCGLTCSSDGNLGGGYISQSISGLAIGQTYNISFWLMNEVGTTGFLSQGMQVLLDGTYVSHTFPDPSPGTPGTTLSGGTVLFDLATSGASPPFGYMQFICSFTATNTTHLISFSFRQDADFMGFDDGVVEAASPPPPPPPPSGKSCWFSLNPSSIDGLYKGMHPGPRTYPVQL